MFVFLQCEFDNTLLHQNPDNHLDTVAAFKYPVSGFILASGNLVILDE